MANHLLFHGHTYQVSRPLHLVQKPGSRIKFSMRFISKGVPCTTRSVAGKAVEKSYKDWAECIDFGGVFVQLPRYRNELAKCECGFSFVSQKVGQLSANFMSWDLVHIAIPI